MARLNISMNNEMVKYIEKKAEDEGKTISSYIAEAVKSYSNIKNAGLQKEDMEFMLKYVSMFISIGVVPVPAFLLDEITKISFSKSSDTVSNAWYERGKIAADILKGYATTLEELWETIKHFRPFLPLNMIELKITNKNVEVTISGSGYSIEASKCTAEGLRGVLEIYDVKTNNYEIASGFVKVYGIKK